MIENGVFWHSLKKSLVPRYVTGCLDGCFVVFRLPSAVRTVRKCCSRLFGSPALLILTAVHFYISAVKWSFVDWNTLLKTEPQTDGLKKRLSPVLHSH